MEVKTDGVAMKSNPVKASQPFYEPPQRKTSAEIINEARIAIRGMLSIMF